MLLNYRLDKFAFTIYEANGWKTAGKGSKSGSLCLVFVHDVLNYIIKKLLRWGEWER